MDSPTSSVGPVFWVDSGNFFNAYHMAALAQHQGWDPKVALRALRLARPFTAFQFQKMLGKIPGPTPLKTPLVFVSDLMGLFYEEEIQEADVNRAFREFLKQLLTLKQRAMVLALLLDHSIPPARRALLPRVLALVDHVHTSFQERLAA